MDHLEETLSRYEDTMDNLEGQCDRMKVQSQNDKKQVNEAVHSLEKEVMYYNIQIQSDITAIYIKPTYM